MFGKLINLLEEEYISCKEQHKKTLAECKKLEDEITSLKKEVSSLKRKNTQLEKKNKSLQVYSNETVSYYETKLTSLRDDLVEADKEIDALNQNKVKPRSWDEIKEEILNKSLEGLSPHRLAFKAYKGRQTERVNEIASIIQIIHNENKKYESTASKGVL